MLVGLVGQVGQWLLLKRLIWYNTGGRRGWGGGGFEHFASKSWPGQKTCIFVTLCFVALCEKNIYILWW